MLKCTNQRAVSGSKTAAKKAIVAQHSSLICIFATQPKLELRNGKYKIFGNNS